LNFFALLPDPVRRDLFAPSRHKRKFPELMSLFHVFTGQIGKA
jgi:hypothetical protein